MRLSALEEKLFETGEFELAQAAFIASGANNEIELANYLSKLDHICIQMSSQIGDSANLVERARSIFDWLWRAKPRRYESQSNFQLTEVVDAQLDPGRSIVGNCLGLTLLYNVLAQRSGLEVQAVYLEEAFGRGPHLFSVLNIDERWIDIENIFPYGFDYGGHRRNPLRRQWDDRDLAADIYNSRGSRLFEGGHLEDCLDYYEKAILLSPKHPRAHLNIGIVLSELGRVEEAKECFQRSET